MPRWLRIVRGMLGMGLTFSVGVGVVASVVAGIPLLLLGGASGPEIAKLIVASSIWAFPIGVVFSGVMAITAGGRSFDQFSIPRFALLGAGAGLLPYALLAANAWSSWSLQNALGNAAIFVFLGSGSATAALLLARRAGPALKSGEEPPTLSQG